MLLHAAASLEPFDLVLVMLQSSLASVLQGWDVDKAQEQGSWPCTACMQ